MFPGYISGNLTPQQVDSELAALGVSIVAVVRQLQLGWRYLVASEFNRRITGETAIALTGPASGHAWLQVSYDPTGTLVRGTFDNSAGGKTPRGTLLSCEENFPNRFANRDALAAACHRGGENRLRYHRGLSAWPVIGGEPGPPSPPATPPRTEGHPRLDGPGGLVLQGGRFVTTT
jgi:secreted PhoX family phosphatase